MGTLKCDGYAKERWFALKRNGMTRWSAMASPKRKKNR